MLQNTVINEKDERGSSSLSVTEPLVSIIIVTYNSLKDVDDNLQSILMQSYTRFEIIIVDNASTDGTPDYIKKNYPLVRVFKSYTNLGYCGGNALGAKLAIGSYIAILNADVVLDKFWLEELMTATKKFPRAAILGSNVLFFSNPSYVNTYGVRVHYTGLAFTRLLGSHQSECKCEDVLAPAGTAFLTSMAFIQKIPFIQPTYFMELGEIDFAIRALLSGYEIKMVPQSKAYHKYLYKMSPRRLYALERSRYLLLTETFSKKTIALLLPSLALTELITFTFSLYLGKEFLRAKIGAIELLLKKFWKPIRSAHVEGNDKTVLEHMDWKIELPETLQKSPMGVPLKKLFDALFFGLRRLALLVM
jgi:GT2 family glycosyltransferase